MSSPNTNKVTVFLDESGDLGWNFTAPYRKGGSSRHLTIAAVLIPNDKIYYIARLLKKLSQKFNWETNKEKKWCLMKHDEKDFFAMECENLKQKLPEINYMAITVYKPRVMSHIRTDPNKLYNYMIGHMLLDKISEFSVVNFVPDPRSVKIESGNSLPDYLQTQLWFEKKVTTELINNPRDSYSCPGIQFCDMLAGVVQTHYEDNQTPRFDRLKKYLDCKRLYFSKPAQPAFDFSRIVEDEITID